jgi:hypothetical protein
MKKSLKLTLIGALLVLAVVVVFVAAGCGTATQNAAQGPAPSTAEGILAQAATASQTLTSGTGQFNLSLSVAGDASKLPASESALLGQPITLSGTVAFNENPQALDASLTAAIAGQNIALGIKAVDKKAWIQFGGQWYEAPAETAQQTDSTVTTLSAATKDALMQAVKAAGINPVNWLTGLKIVGDETIDGTATTHLQGSVDFTKVMADVTKLMQDKTIQGMMGSLSSGMMGSLGSTDSTGSTGATGTTGATDSTMMNGASTSMSLPSAAELQTQISQMFKNLTVDMWVTKDTYQIRQMQVDATITPPAGTDTQGINSIALKFTMSMAPATTPLTVTAPADVKPFSDLQTALGGLESMFSGILGGSDTDTTVTTVQ